MTEIIELALLQMATEELMGYITAVMAAVGGLDI